MLSKKFLSHDTRQRKKPLPLHIFFTGLFREENEPAKSLSNKNLESRHECIYENKRTTL